MMVRHLALHQRIYDVADLTQSREIGAYKTVDYTQELHLAGRYALVSAGGLLLVIDISDPQNPVLVLC
jgi:hypothetical protein